MVRPAAQAATPPERLALDLREDIETRWAPDPLADCDLLEQLAEPRIARDDVAFLAVPKAGGGARIAPVLSGRALSELRGAISPLQDLAEGQLSPTVCGYRAGSTADSDHRNEYRRFREMTKVAAADYSHVVTADVSTFFDSVNIETIAPIITRKYGEAAEPTIDALRTLNTLGVKGLPAGYGDARFIANIILAVAEEGFPYEFTRWVDDYRIFVNSDEEAHFALSQLQSGLRRVGLTLNKRKVSIVRQSEVGSRILGRDLDSVYHPGEEPDRVVRASLRGVFLDAATSGNRRALRFSLPRLASEGDDIALDFAFQALTGSSLDAPRIVAYIAHFIDTRSVQERVREVTGAVRNDTWVLTRLAPLLARIDLPQGLVDLLARSLEEHSQHPVTWGLLLRTLSVHQQEGIVSRALRGSIPDPRAALAATSDLGLTVTSEVADRARPSLRAIDRLSRIPLPSTESIL